jgi:hypothetical protein
MQLASASESSRVEIRGVEGMQDSFNNAASLTAWRIARAWMLTM